MTTKSIISSSLSLFVILSSCDNSDSSHRDSSETHQSRKHERQISHKHQNSNNVKFGEIEQTITEDPEAARQYFSSLSTEDLLGLEFLRFFSSNINNHPEFLIEYFHSIKGDGVRDAILNHAILDWKGPSLDGLRALIKSLPDSSQSKYRDALLKVAIKSRPNEAAKLIKDYPLDEQPKAEAIATLLDASKPVDQKLALLSKVSADWEFNIIMRDLFSTARTTNEIISSMANLEPTLALRIASSPELDTSKLNESQLNDILSAVSSAPLTKGVIDNTMRLLDKISTSNPKVAYTFLVSQNIPNSSEKLGNYVGLISIESKSDKFIREKLLTGSPLEQQAASHALGVWTAAFHPEKIEAELSGVSAELKSDFANKALEIISFSKPDLVKNLYSTESEIIKNLTNEERNRHLKSVVLKEVSRSVETASQYVTSLPAIEDRVSATRSLTGAWLALDPKGVTEWISGLPPGPQRDSGIHIIIQNIQNTDPEAAEGWRTLISDRNELPGN